MPIASIIIPTYNREQGGYLRRAIDSALNQTISDLEVIVVDGGSTDDTAALINGYSDSRLDYIRFGENEIANKTRNVGIEHADGKYISFLDSDDILAENHVEKSTERLQEESQNCAAVCTSYEHIDDGEIVGSTTIPDGILSKDRIYSNNMGGFSCYTVRSSAFETIPPLQESVTGATDLAFCVKFSQEFSIVGMEDKLVKYSVRDEGRLEGDIEARLNGQEYILERYGHLLSAKHIGKLQFLGGELWLSEDVTEAREHFRNAILSDPQNLAYYYHYVATLLGRRNAITAVKMKSVLFPVVARFCRILKYFTHQ